MKNFTYFLRAVLCLCLFLTAGRLSAQTATAPFTHQGLTASTGDFLGFLQYKPADYDQSPSTQYPMIIFLHGIGERGNGTTDLDKVAYVGLPNIIYHKNKMTFTWNGKTETFLVLAPQCPVKYGMWPASFVDDLIKYAKQNLRIDTNRIFLTGLSMGGGGSLRYISDALPDNPFKLAAVATIAAPCTFNTGKNIAAAHLPVWCFHAEDDPTASVQCTKNALSGMNAWKPLVKPLVDYWPTGGHVVWDRVYTDTNYKYQGVVNIYEWFLGQNKSLPVNKLPVANAGADKSVIGNMIVLDGSASSDADGKLVRYVWKKLSGPASGTIVTPMGANASTTVKGITIPGKYSFELAAVDDRAAFQRDTVNIVVTSVAVASPVPVKDTTSSSSSNSTSSTKPGKDSVAATPPPSKSQTPALKGPVANAGNDIELTVGWNQTLMNGSLSTDDNGWFVSEKWTKISGPAKYTIIDSAALQAHVSNLDTGVYVFRLTVTDNKGASSSDDLKITVKGIPAPVVVTNIAPVANAGSDIEMTLAWNSTLMNGSLSTDKDGWFVSQKWTKISGPAKYTIVDSAALQAHVSNLDTGVYVFRLTVTDNKGASSSDDLKITMRASSAPVVVVTPPVKGPVARVGNDIELTTSWNQTLLNGTLSTDNDGWFVSQKWTKISGPAKYTIVDSAALQAHVSNLDTGVYVFRLTVTDTKGATSSDDLTVTVKAPSAPAVVPNIAPVANAGSDIEMTLAWNSTLINGTLSTDKDGWFVSQKWTKISGPAKYTIVDSAALQAHVSNLDTGVYVFRLTVTDNKGASSSDDLKITMKALPAPVVIPNIAPVANAGKDGVATLGWNQSLLNSTLSKDADGWITSVRWTKISGPAQYRILDSTLLLTSATNLVEGVYTFRVTVKDNRGDSSIDDVNITVLQKLPATVSSSMAITAATIAPQTSKTVVKEGITSISPNPAVSSFQLQYASSQMGQTNISIYDNNGRIIKSVVVMKTQTVLLQSVNINDLTKGIYYAVAQTGSRSYAPVEFVKQ